ncbi:MAG: chorismate synthase [Ectothiorhodospiraceae bacterium]|nr:chorismate synthase [Ectothiorhodospiraceae bacterium]
MRGNSYGNNLVLTSFGESHGVALGAVVDGVPAQIEISEDDFRHDLARRRPGQSGVTTSRNEADEPEILSGIFEGQTLGTPIAVLIRNKDHKSDEYDKEYKRPGHAETAWEHKYGIRDYRGGGRASGRETIARVIGGTIAKKILPKDLQIHGFTRKICGIEAENIPQELSTETIDANSVRCPDSAAAKKMEELILEAKESGDSLGGIAELRITGVPAGLGEPTFRKAKSELAAAMMSVGAVSTVSLGLREEEFELPGSVFHVPLKAGIAMRSHGIQGGITNGEPITLYVFIKPPSTTGSMATKGRHDPCILPRVIPVLEAMAAFTLADLFLSARMDRL